MSLFYFFMGARDLPSTVTRADVVAEPSSFLATHSYRPSSSFFTLSMTRTPSAPSVIPATCNRSVIGLKFARSLRPFSADYRVLLTTQYFNSPVTWAFFHWNTIFLPRDVRTRNSLSIACQHQGAATVHLLVCQILTQPGALPRCRK